MVAILAMTTTTATVTAEVDYLPRIYPTGQVVRTFPYDIKGCQYDIKPGHSYGRR